MERKKSEVSRTLSIKFNLNYIEGNVADIFVHWSDGEGGGRMVAHGQVREDIMFIKGLYLKSI